MTPVVHVVARFQFKLYCTWIGNVKVEEFVNDPALYTIALGPVLFAFTYVSHRMVVAFVVLNACGPDGVTVRIIGCAIAPVGPVVPVVPVPTVPVGPVDPVVDVAPVGPSDPSIKEMVSSQFVVNSTLKHVYPPKDK